MEGTISAGCGDEHVDELGGRYLFTKIARSAFITYRYLHLNNGDKLIELT